MDKTTSIPTSESGSSPPAYTPPGSTDPGWKYGYLMSKSDTNSVTCRLCSKIIKGGINRLKQHLAHIRGNVAPCKQVDEETKKAIKDYMEGLSKKKEVKAKDLREVREEVDIGGGETNTGVGGRI
ncbi:hypothetical protein QJS04_geneDACA019298 [Acorus gramineus]|uniref:BED-type domain-containing protein n=1 Tax=Acorus gramineus TaxID=55184 RepID=A0AAV9A3G1_ACOGR|nr:hypothetical protein QJS04_geneDACA019298 [Acorus gramineus]